MLIRSRLAWMWGLLCVSSLAFTLAKTAHLSKEFVSARREAARSMEPKHDFPAKGPQMDVDAVLCGKYRNWSEWSPCNKKCEQTRVRRCDNPAECGRTWVKEKRTCSRDRGSCSPLSYKIIGMQRRNRMIEEILYDLLYHPWTPWGPCTRSCRQRRTRKCKGKPVCKGSYIQEERRCMIKDSECEHRYSLKPVDLDVIPGRNDSYELDEEDNESSEESGFPKPGEISEVDKGDKTDTDDDEKDILLKEDKEKGTDQDGSVSDDEDSDNEDDDGNTDSINRIFRVAMSGKSKPQDKGKKKKRQGKRIPLMPKRCGIRPRQFGGSYRVVGGQEVRKNSWPWQVAIMTTFHEQYCGGTLIAPRWVLTAAHCVRKNGKRRRLIVRIGEHDTNNYDVTQGDIRPEKEFPHPAFDYHTITNDIALIKLRHTPSTFNRPRYACLPTVDFAPGKGRLCTVIGWGKIKSTNVHGADALHAAQVPVVKHRKCQRVFDYHISHRQVCAGYKNGGIDSCAGDSGGPLLCKDNKRYVLFGVTSYGEGCGLKGKYGIYSKVSSYLKWIYKTIRENS